MSKVGGRGSGTGGGAGGLEGGAQQGWRNGKVWVSRSWEREELRDGRRNGVRDRLSVVSEETLKFMFTGLPASRT